MSRQTQRLRRPWPSDEGPVPVSPEQQQAADRRPWTIDRIRRGVQRRAGRLTGGLRDRILLPIIERSAWLSSLHYALFSSAFRREHAAVIRGRRRYELQGRLVGRHDYLLRRNIHMLEKGLVMRPRRAVFALEYINATVTTYVEMARLHGEAPDLVDAEQVRWAHDVLEAYFNVAGPHTTIDKVRAKFTAAPAVFDADSDARVPYSRDTEGPPPVRYEDLLALAYRRRSVRWYLPIPVPRPLIDQALEVAALSPSACNRQPFEFRVYDDPVLAQRVAAVPKGTRGFGHNFPAFAVVVGRMRAFFSERDRHLIYIDGSLAAMAFALALESLGLSSCLINWADEAEQERQIGALLNLDADERVVMCISFGYADPSGMVPYSEKKPLELFRRYNAT